jgi:hypothetical protein
MLQKTGDLLQPGRRQLDMITLPNQQKETVVTEGQFINIRFKFVQILQFDDEAEAETAVATLRRELERVYRERWNKPWTLQWAENVGWVYGRVAAEHGFALVRCA